MPSVLKKEPRRGIGDWTPMPRRGGIAAVVPAGPARSFADRVEESSDGHVGGHREGARVVGAAVAPLAKDVSLIRRGGDRGVRHGRKAAAACHRAPVGLVGECDDLIEIHYRQEGAEVWRCEVKVVP